MAGSFFERWFPHDANNLAGLYEEVRRVLPEDGAVLDLGCGFNFHLGQFRTPRRQVWGVDVHRHPELQHPDWFRLLGPAGAIPFADASFDVVVTNMVLEHIADPAAFLLEVGRVLRPGGFFLGHTVSAIHYVMWLRQLVGRLPHAWNQALVRRLYGREEHDTFPAYYRMNTPRRLARLAAPLGFRLERVRRYANPGYFAFSALLYRGAVITDWLCDKLIPGMGRIYFTATLRKEQIAVRLAA